MFNPDRTPARGTCSIAAMAITVSALVAAVLAGPATAAVAVAPESGPWCVMVVGKSASADQPSPVEFQYCSTTLREDARSSLRSAAAPTSLGTRAIASSDLLMTWFRDANYGSPLTDIYGSAGTCDSAGYRLAPNYYWQTNLSSAAGYGQCNRARFTARSNTFAGTFILPVNNLGQTLNDNVGFINVYNRR